MFLKIHKNFYHLEIFQYFWKSYNFSKISAHILFNFFKILLKFQNSENFFLLFLKIWRKFSFLQSFLKNSSITLEFCKISGNLTFFPNSSHVLTLLIINFSIPNKFFKIYRKSYIFSTINALILLNIFKFSRNSNIQKIFSNFFQNFRVRKFPFFRNFLKNYFGPTKNFRKFYSFFNIFRPAYFIA